MKKGIRAWMSLVAFFAIAPVGLEARAEVTAEVCFTPGFAPSPDGQDGWIDDSQLTYIMEMRTRLQSAFGGNLPLESLGDSYAVIGIEETISRYLPRLLKRAMAVNPVLARKLSSVLSRQIAPERIIFQPFGLDIAKWAYLAPARRCYQAPILRWHLEGGSAYIYIDQRLFWNNPRGNWFRASVLLEAMIQILAEVEFGGSIGLEPVLVLRPILERGPETLRSRVTALEHLGLGFGMPVSPVHDGARMAFLSGLEAMRDFLSRHVIDPEVQYIHVRVREILAKYGLGCGEKPTIAACLAALRSHLDNPLISASDRQSLRLAKERLSSGLEEYAAIVANEGYWFALHSRAADCVRELAKAGATGGVGMGLVNHLKRDIETRLELAANVMTRGYAGAEGVSSLPAYDATDVLKNIENVADYYEKWDLPPFFSALGEDSKCDPAEAWIDPREWGYTPAATPSPAP